jgi:hypothetical protein
MLRTSPHVIDIALTSPESLPTVACTVVEASS